MLLVPAVAHEVEGRKFTLPPSATQTETSQIVGDGKPFYPQIVEGVVDNFKLWQTGSTVTACFFESSAVVRARFVSVANEWLAYAKLKIDFGIEPSYRTCDANASQIRIAFESKGNWSYVGSDSIRVDLTKPSLNIQDGAGNGQVLIDQLSFRATVLHEMGHALALQHEHQSPEAGCEDELKWDVIYAAFQTEYGWDKSKVDANLRSLVKSPRFRTTEYDPKSIMHYSFPGWMFTAGEGSKCFVGHNKDISELDKKAIAIAYPDSPKGQMDYLRSRGDFAQQVLTDLGVTSQQKERIGALINKTVVTAAPGFSISITASNCSGGGITTSGSYSPVFSCADTKGGDINYIINSK